MESRGDGGTFGSMALVQDHANLHAFLVCLDQSVCDGGGGEGVGLEMDRGFGLPDCRHDGLSAASVWREAYFYSPGFGSVECRWQDGLWGFFLARTVKGPMHLGAEVDAECEGAEECGQQAVGFVSHTVRGEPGADV